MPSPFPGMDPWLERPAIFPDFHDSLIAAMRIAINAVLPPPYFAAIANRIWFEGAEQHIEPDVDVLKPPTNNGMTNESNGAVAVADAVRVKPVIVHVPRRRVIERFLEIHAAADGAHLVTTIEVLSLSNKQPGKGRREYLRKQNQTLESQVNLVEVDLLRRGLHVTAVSAARAVKKAGPFDYHVCVHRLYKAEEYEVYPIVLREALPLIAIPLLPETADVVIDLQQLLNQCYDTGLYGRRIRYGKQRPHPPLSEEQSQWANNLLRERGLLT